MTVRFTCNECGGDKLQIPAWITMNGEKLVDGDGPTDQIWCPDCDKEVKANEEVIEDAPEKPVLTAFWSYDLYPYVLSAEVSNTREMNGHMEYYTPSYRMWVRPAENLEIVEGREGRRIAAALKTLRSSYASAHEQMLNDFQYLATQEAPFLRKWAPYKDKP